MNIQEDFESTNKTIRNLSLIASSGTAMFLGSFFAHFAEVRTTPYPKDGGVTISYVKNLLKNTQAPLTLASKDHIIPTKPGKEEKSVLPKSVEINGETSQGCMRYNAMTISPTYTICMPNN